MFQLDTSTRCVDIPANRVVHLFRSMREVQMALPGFSSQQASAYLCQFDAGKGFATLAAFHLHKEDHLAFYFSDPKLVPQEKLDSMLDRGLNFVESMGFLMTDQDIHLLDGSDKEMLWSSLPLKAGLCAGEPSPTEAPAEMVAKTLAAEPPAAEPVSVDQSEPVVEAEAAGVEEQQGENVDDLLAAVEVMRARRPGLRARKLRPSPEELERRRTQLRETIGRILGSL
jgi:hypothetical protein